MTPNQIDHLNKLSRNLQAIGMRKSDKGGGYGEIEQAKCELSFYTQKYQEEFRVRLTEAYASQRRVHQDPVQREQPSLVVGEHDPLNPQLA
jgi:hypothetical protein